jgi:hypothetical protein
VEHRVDSDLVEHDLVAHPVKVDLIVLVKVARALHLHIVLHLPVALVLRAVHLVQVELVATLVPLVVAPVVTNAVEQQVPLVKVARARRATRVRRYYAKSSTIWRLRN